MHLMSAGLLTMHFRAFLPRITFQLSREQLKFEELATAKKGKRLMSDSLGIQARSLVFSLCVSRRQAHLERDPLQKCHFAATKASRHKPSPLTMHKAGRCRSRQVVVRSGQVKLCQVKSSQVKSSPVRSRQVKAGQVRSEQA